MKQIIFDNMETIPIRCSVREFVEFLLRSGDLDSRSSHRDPDAMKEGADMHRKLQKAHGGNYAAEVNLSHTCLVTYGRHTFSLTVEGRADGILTISDETRGELMNEALVFSNVTVAIDEIKTMLRDVARLHEPVPEHLAQAKCYAYFYCMQEELSEIAVQMTYVTLGSGKQRFFTEFYTRDELAEWFYSLCREYAKFEEWRVEHAIARDASIHSLGFPFAYRPGQQELVKGVYRTIMRERKLFLEAPTGVGKTISTIFPAVKSMGEGLTEKLFYLTAKTIARTVAENTFSLLTENGLVFLPITITAKEKLCVLPKPDCNPAACPRAKGHFDRINDAIYALLSALVVQGEAGEAVNDGRCESTLGEAVNDGQCESTQGKVVNDGQCESTLGEAVSQAYMEAPSDTESTANRRGLLITRELIIEYAERYQVCPYEMSLDVALFADAVICDYNYVFDPEVYFRRFFAGETRHNYALLIDEAHNLVERAREMYSATLVKEDFLAAKQEMDFYPPAVSALQACNREMLALKKEHEGFAVLESLDTLYYHLMRFCGVIDEFSAENPTSVPEFTKELYFNARHFLSMYEESDDHYRFYCDYAENNHFLVRLQCMDPSRPLDRRISLCRSAVFFSATLLPIHYYKSQLSGQREDYAVYADSPFDPDNCLVLLAGDVSTRYTRRTAAEYQKIASYITDFCAARKGNYMAFFPSYSFLSNVELLLRDVPGLRLLTQGNSMTEAEREEFLSTFAEDNEETLLGMCVMGGIFSEGIDLTADRLIGAIIVGPGLPTVCNERNLFREYYDERCDMGFEYAYMYPGMNKVLQSGGRVIRTTEDVGAILLLDDRFSQPAYNELLPREWQNCRHVNRATLPDILEDFWRRKPET